MKKAIRILAISVMITIASLLVSSVLAQPQPGGDPSGAGGGTGTPVGGGMVPVGSGMIILLALGAGYGAKKVYNARKKLLE